MNAEKLTPLYQKHLDLGGKMVPFAGYMMPVQYPFGSIMEYRSVRENAGLFDISHMGQIDISGDGANAFLQYICCNDVNTVGTGQVQYSAILNTDGGFVDDITVYCFSHTHYMLCVNAANRAAVMNHMQTHAANFDVAITDQSDSTVLLALQGPKAESILQHILGEPVKQLEYYHFIEHEWFGEACVVSRTGYTGEDGVEIYAPEAAGVAIWQQLLDLEAVPCGLASRDVLRTEMGYALYGHEINAVVTPIEAGLKWIVKMDVGDFIGRDALEEQLSQGVKNRRVALQLEERGIPREGYRILSDSGEETGVVTSGAHSPMLEQGVALAMLSKPAENMAIEIRGKAIPAKQVKLPFVRSNVRRSSK